MSSIETMVFADISGSTALYEALGNERAAAVVTALTQVIAATMTEHAGRVVKTLGDGVLGIFDSAQAAAESMVTLMRQHQHWAHAQPEQLQLPIRAGLASGVVVFVDGDCYGDAVNMAARLCERAGHNEIWMTDSAVDALVLPSGLSLVRMGRIEVRGKSELLTAYQVEWREEEEGVDFQTMHADLESSFGGLGTGSGEIQLAWSGANRLFTSENGPVTVGRATNSDLHIHDPRVSRQHARVEWRQGAFELVDLSSFGTWVRFDGSDSLVQLRRDSCLLHGSGEIALGVHFADASAPKIAFQVRGTNVRLG